MVLKSGKKATLDPGWSFRHLILVGISWNISDVLNKSVNSLCRKKNLILELKNAKLHLLSP